MAPRLDSLLGHALLDERAVTQAQLEEALQQQLIHGGALDTVLLELGLLDEVRLAGLLSRAWQTAPVRDDELLRFDPAAVKLLPSRMAVTMGLCPFQLSQGALHVLSAAPLDRPLLDEVAGVTGLPLVPHVVPEVQLMRQLARCYAAPLDERFAALTPERQKAAADAAAAAPPVLLADDDGARWDLAEALAHLAAQETREGIARVAITYARRFLPFAAIFGIRGGAAVGWHRAGPSEGVAFQGRNFPIPDDCVLYGALSSPAPLLGKPPITPGNQAFLGWLGRRRPRTLVIVPIVVAKRTVAALAADSGIRARDFSELSDLAAFGQRLGPAFEALLRARHRAHPSLYPTPAPPPSIPPRPLPAGDAPAKDGSSPFAREYQPRPLPKAPVVEPPAPGFVPPDPAFVLDDVPAPPPLAAASTRRPTEAFLPTGAELALVAAATAEATKRVDRRSDTNPFFTMPVEDMQAAIGAAKALPPDESQVLAAQPAPPLAQASLVPVFAQVVEHDGGAAWQGALQSTIESGRQGGIHDAKTPIFIDTDDGWEDVVMDAAHSKELGVVEEDEAPIPLATPKRTITKPLPAWQAPETEEEAPAAPPVITTWSSAQAPTAPSWVAPVTRPMPQTHKSSEELVDDLASRDPFTVATARGDLLILGEAALPALTDRFPGKMLVDVFDSAKSTKVPEEVSHVLAVLQKLGPVGLSAAIPHLDSRYPAHRYAAVLLFAATPDPRAIEMLRPRLGDQEPRIREVAAEALLPFVAHPRFESVLQYLRERLRAPIPESRRRAAVLLGTFRDVGAVPHLIDMLEENRGELGHEARTALRPITLQDFGTRAKAWHRWWAKAKRKTRMDWLLDGLLSEDRDLRAQSLVELEQITGDSFGYKIDDPKGVRDRAVDVFHLWWKTERVKVRPTP